MPAVITGRSSPPGAAERRAMASGSLTIIDALDDPALFANHFKGPSWAPWRVYLKALFALPLNEAELPVYRHHSGRQHPPATPSQYSALVVGRRGGKSRVMALLAIWAACFRSYKAHLAPGEKAVVSIIGANRHQCRVILRYIAGAMREIPLLKPLIAEELAESVVLTNDVIIEVATASFRTVRGSSVVCCVCDEIAFWRGEDSVSPDFEVIRAIRPSMANIPGSMLILASSPHAKRGVLYDVWKRNFANDTDARALVWQGTSLEMNSSLDPAVVVEAYEDDPESASAEFGAEFRSDIAAFIDRTVVDACTQPGRHELGYISSNRYFSFVDPSGGSNDSYCVCISHAERSGIGPAVTTTAVLDVIREYKPPFSPEAITAEIADILKQYKISTVTGDRYAGEFPRELFRKKGIEYKLSDRPASDIFRDALPMLNSGTVQLLDNERLQKQLIALERRTARSGKDSISHPPNGHDDIAVVCMGAALLCTGAGQNDWIARFKALAS